MKPTHRYKVVDDELRIYEGSRAVFKGTITEAQKVALIKQLADALHTIDWRDL